MDTLNHWMNALTPLLLNAALAVYIMGCCRRFYDALRLANTQSEVRARELAHQMTTAGMVNRNEPDQRK